MKIRILLFALLLIDCFILKAQGPFLEFGLGTKYDVFKIKQSENTFQRNFDFGATAFISYGRPFINTKVYCELGLATNNYKINFKINGPSGTVYSQRELVSVMRSNRLFFNIAHLSKKISPKVLWVNTFGISLLIGAKNPYDVILQRSKSIETDSGSRNVDVKIKTFGLTGSALLVGASTKLYYQMSKDFKLVANLGFIAGMGELTRIEVDYVFDSAPNYKKAVFTTNGFAPMFTLGVNYRWGE